MRYRITASASAGGSHASDSRASHALLARNSPSLACRVFADQTSCTRCRFRSQPKKREKKNAKRAARNVRWPGHKDHAISERLELLWGRGRRCYRSQGAGVDLPLRIAGHALPPPENISRKRFTEKGTLLSQWLVSRLRLQMSLVVWQPGFMPALRLVERPPKYDGLRLRSPKSDTSDTTNVQLPSASRFKTSPNHFAAGRVASQRTVHCPPEKYLISKGSSATFVRGRCGRTRAPRCPTSCRARGSGTSGAAAGLPEVQELAVVGGHG